MRPIRFNVIVKEMSSRAAWQNLARQAEDLGYSTLLASDHPGMPDALTSLVSAADATTALRVGTRVLTTDFFHPIRLAQEAATVDVLTDGRFELGLGTGWAREEYQLLGVPFGPPARRARRLAEAIEAMCGVWSAAHEIGVDCGNGNGGPPTVQLPHPPIVIGGQGDPVLRVAGRYADVVSLTGAAFVDGQFRPARVSAAEVGERIGFLRDAAGSRFADIELGLRVMVVITDGDAGAIAQMLSAATGVPTEVIVDSPYALIGSPAQVVDKVLAVRENLGLTSYDVEAHAMEALAPVIAALGEPANSTRR